MLKISPSISREDDVAILNLKGGSVVPGLSNATTFRLEYDRDQMELGKFKKGDTWIITFTNAGELVAMRKVIEL